MLHVIMLIFVKVLLISLKNNWTSPITHAYLGYFKAKALDTHTDTETDTETEAIGVSWDANALSRRGVKRIRLEAQPLNKSLPLLKSEIDASAGEATLSDNVMPSTNYSIHVQDVGESGFEYSTSAVRTRPSGELLPCHNWSRSVRSIPHSIPQS